MIGVWIKLSIWSWCSVSVLLLVASDQAKPTLHELTNPAPGCLGLSVFFHDTTRSPNSCPNPLVWFSICCTVMGVFVSR